MSEEPFVQTKRCCICNELLDVKRTDEGKVYWTNGHNAEPVMTGRCCDVCQWGKVMPARLEAVFS
jgi:hypothetical protein